MSNWTADEHKAVSKVILGSWPGTVTAWGKEGFSAYIGELEARGLTSEQVLTAIRTWPAGSDFPPSAPNLAAAARKDPDRPTPDELLQQLYAPGGVFGFKRQGVMISSWTLAFVECYGRDRLRLLEVDGPHGELVRKDLKQSYKQFLEANEGRTAAQLIGARRRGEIGRLDPVAAIGGAIEGDRA